MENSQINIVADLLPLQYRKVFITKLIDYVYGASISKLRAELDALIDLHGSSILIFNGRKYTHSRIANTVSTYNSVLLLDKYKDLASTVIDKKINITEKIENFKSVSSVALTKCKSIADVKLLFTEEIFNKCEVICAETPSMHQAFITTESITEFTTEHPNYITSIKEQLLTNMLIY